MTVDIPVVAERINRLFDVAHLKEDPEQTTGHVARSISTILGQDIPASRIEELRGGEAATPPEPELLRALEQHFDAPRTYLTEDGPHAAAVDFQLQVVIRARNAGVKRIEARHGKGPFASAIAEILTQLPPEPPAKTDVDA
ncbi:hypothetical protein [Rhodococcus sp. IEGM 1307]|uniref:hypothetical protein n=1 Tax=Rhodococcus sp. IEGM 1307 TaxID=3047091 RepID=UPI0024B7FC7B|nr:hypothetical protein [Rhodococcus sp. IEGM 1307]MDI9979375.1 hypothetical protein [Rhodococcus sp. IEGM 1307]